MSHRLCQSPPRSVGTQGTQAELLHLQFSYEKCPTTHCCGFSLDSWSAKAQLMTLVLDPAGLWRGRAAGFCRVQQPPWCRAPRPLWPGQPSKSQETLSYTTQGENTANWSRTKYPTTYHDSNYTIQHLATPNEWMSPQTTKPSYILPLLPNPPFERMQITQLN